MKFSTNWKASKSPSKQRKYVYKAPAHVRQKFVSVNLNKTLRSQHNKRNVEVRIGDKVKVLRGTYKGKTGAITRIDRVKCKLIIDGVDIAKKDGSKTPYPIHPSNCQIESLEMKDKRRFKERSAVKSKEQPVQKPKTKEQTKAKESKK